MNDGSLWREEPVGRHHDRIHFDCGVAELNEYLARYARRNHGTGGAKTFVAVLPAEPQRVLAYYSISPSVIEFGSIPVGTFTGMGRYEVPVFRLGRLAVSRVEQGKRLGSRLLFAAARRAMAAAAQVGGVALAIDAKDEAASHWYARFGAERLRDDPPKMIVPFDVLAAAIRQADDERR